MNRIVLGEPPAQGIQDPALKAGIKRLCAADHATNWLYILRAWLFLAAAIAAALWLHQARAAAGWHWLWTVAIVAAAVPLIGAGQHQLAGLGHEGSHNSLFANRWANELASDWLCMFPLFSSTQHYRLQHVAHHQFTNDPDRDPDVSQLQQSGHWMPFPMKRGEFLRALLAAVRPLKLVRYAKARANYGGGGANPYAKPGTEPPRMVAACAVAFMLTLVGTLVALTAWAPWPVLLGVPPALLAAALVGFSVIPDRKYLQTRLRGRFTQKQITLQRLAFLGLLFTALAWATRATGQPAWAWFLALWALPLLTAFPLYMILRQLVQHGNADRGWLSNTRVFLMNPCTRFAVFPIGQDYHLPHHVYASVPHYNLPALHELLMGAREYAAEAVVVEGYFAPRRTPPRPPTAVEIVGPEHAPRGHAVHLDHSVLDTMTVDGKEDFLREASPDGK